MGTAGSNTSRCMLNHLAAAQYSTELVPAADNRTSRNDRVDRVLLFLRKRSIEGLAVITERASNSVNAPRMITRLIRRQTLDRQLRMSIADREQSGNKIELT